MFSADSKGNQSGESVKICFVGFYFVFVLGVPSVKIVHLSYLGC